MISSTINLNILTYYWPEIINILLESDTMNITMQRLFKTDQGFIIQPMTVIVIHILLHQVFVPNSLCIL